jgi:hypothetical protein
MVNQAVSTQEQNRQLEDKFFARWPLLNKAEYRGDIVKLATAHRGAFPDESTEQLIENVGLQGMIRFKIRPPEEVAAQEQEPEQEPFRPAAPQRAAAPPPPAKPKNVYTEMAEEMLEDDSLY